MSVLDTLSVDAHEQVEIIERAAIDLLGHAIERVRPMLDRKSPLKARCRAFWAAAKNSRNLAAGELLTASFFKLARDSGLLADLRPHGEETIRHLISWGLRGKNPFETGPLL